MNLKKLDNPPTLDIPPPLITLDVGVVTVFVWRKPGMHAEAMDTEPYERNGKIPLVFIQFGFIELCFYSHMVYNYLYKREYGCLPEVVGEN